MSVRAITSAGLVGPIILGAVIWSGPAALADCSQAQRTSGECSEVTIDNDGGQVSIGREEFNPGSPGGEQSDPGHSLPGATPPSQPWQPPPIRMDTELGSPECEISVQGLCRGSAPSKNPPVSTPPTTTLTPPTPPRYASELRSFRPRPPGITIEPGTWSVPTLPTNMIARATAHTQRGELLGWPVEVRFTPVAYHWGFGDSTNRSTPDPGSPWSHRGLTQFADTPTAHRYSRPGQYRVTLQVDYRVEFRFEDDEFDDISGLVSAQAPPVTLKVLTVSPLLFDGDN